MQEQTGHADVWRAIYEQAACWETIPAVQALLDGLPRSVEDLTREVPQMLQEFRAGHGSLMTNSFRLGRVVEMLVGNAGPPPSAGGAPVSAIHAWLQNARIVEEAHRVTVSWIRSRLPDYPIIRAPHLARHTAYTTDDFTHLLSWPVEHQQAGLQLMSVPPPLGEALGASRTIDLQITATTTEVARTLAKTAEWAAFADAAQDLTPADKEQLRNVRRTLTARLSPAAVDEYEIGRVVSRANYRINAVNEELETLSGGARTYTDTFGSVNRLIDLATSEVLSAIVTQVEVPTLPAINPEFGANTPGSIEFELHAGYGFLLDCGDVAWLEEPLIPDAVRLESISHSFNATGAGGTRIRASILAGTAEGWAR